MKWIIWAENTTLKNPYCFLIIFCLVLLPDIMKKRIRKTYKNVLVKKSCLMMVN